MGKPHAPCGTYSAYRRHLREHEPVDDACRKAQHDRDASRSSAKSEPGAARRQVRIGAEQSRPALSLVPPLAAAEQPGHDDEQVDTRAELLANLALVRAAMAVVALEDPKRLAPLSKRHSELLTEVKAIGAAGAVEEDPFDVFLGGGPAGLPASAPRKSS